jgi:hypothetical protein
MFKNVRLTPRFEVSDEPVVEQGEQGIDMTAAELRQIAGKMRWYVRCREGLWGDDPEATRMAQRCDDTAELLDRASGLTDADIKPILGGPHVDEATGRVWQPEDTDKATGPFVIGKLAQDRIASRRRRRSSMVKTFPTDQA